MQVPRCLQCIILRNSIKTVFFSCKSSKLALLIFAMIKAPKDQEGPYGFPAALVGEYPPFEKDLVHRMPKRWSHLPD